MKRFMVLGWALSTAGFAGAAEFASNWRGDRVWVGPQYWANPLYDWRVDGQEVVAQAAADRTLHLLTHQIRKPGGFSASVTVRLSGTVPPKQRAKVWAGMKLGISGAIDDYRHALVHGKPALAVGVRADGRLFVGPKTSRGKISLGRPVQLAVAAQGRGKVTVRAGGQSVTHTVGGVKSLRGNIALASHGVTRRRRAGLPEWRFRDWRVAGDAVEANPSQTFGPICWTQYTLSGGVLTLTAQMAPVGRGEGRTVRLQFKRGDKWAHAQQAAIRPLSRVVKFRLPWKSVKTTAYRVVYNWRGEDHTWGGVIRAEPKGPRFRLGVFSCDNGYVFPNSLVTRNVAIQNPDMLFFAGDQIYESFGGFGIVRGPTDIAVLDYLRKYYQFGWSWRELLKDRPSVIIPDDHDVFQGNIWGEGGRKLKRDKNRFNFNRGGYAMAPAWVNAIQETQTAHLPSPIDPKPIKQGIGVYFTGLLYGGVQFAVIEDRKFKTGPDGKTPTRRQVTDPKQFDVPGMQLLGGRQEEFLTEWSQSRPGSAFKVVLSQTILCKVTTHAGRELKRSRFDLDTNGWPQSGRRRALAPLIGKGVVMIHGDQHLGALVRHGVDEWDDGPIGFMVPGTANGFPRAWWPDRPGRNRDPKEPAWTGRYRDDLGNRITVLAAGNLERGSHKLPRGGNDPVETAHRKGSGHGTVIFNRETGGVTFQLWRLKFDANDPKPGDQFVGFPKTVKPR